MPNVPTNLPPWFQDVMAQLNLTPEAAAQLFADFEQQGGGSVPEGVVSDGGFNDPSVNSHPENDPTKAPPLPGGPQGGGPPQDMNDVADPNYRGQLAGGTHTPPPQPTAPPAGAPPGRWLLRGDRQTGYTWRFLADNGSGFYNAPAAPVVNPADTTQASDVKPNPHTTPAPPVPPAPVDPWNYRASSATPSNANRQGTQASPAPAAKAPVAPPEPSLQPNRRPRPRTTQRRAGVPGSPALPANDSNLQNPMTGTGATYKRDYD